MTPERWQQIKRLFDAALAQQPASLPAYLADACAGDEELRRQVETMLAADAQVDGLLDRPAYEAVPELLSIPDHHSELPTAPLAESLVDRQIGVYQLVREIGRGGMGEVYLAHDARLGRDVALKLLPARFTEDPERVRRFQREARAASALNHPNILTIFDIGQEDGRHYIATEFVEGQTLRALVGGAEMTAGKAIDVTMQIASALAAAHKAGIVHRDIKPENVMVRPDGYVKVLDFGLAKLTERSSAEGAGTRISGESWFETQSGMILGTVAYMSPEQARGQKVDARSDIFSLGVVFYELLTGVRPFDGATRNHTLVAILDAEPPPLTVQVSGALSSELQRIVGCALAKDREQRYQSAVALLADLSLLKEELSSAAHSQQAKARGDPSPLTTAAGAAVSTGASDSPEAVRRISSVGKLRPRTVGVMAALALAVIGGLAFALSRWFGWGAIAHLPFAQFQATKLTAPGNLDFGTISPDGKYVAYTLAESSGRYSLCIKQVMGGDGVVVVPPTPASFWSVGFSPDGNFLYYVIDDHNHPVNGELYRVPALGGTPVKLLTNIQGIGSFSPDGQRFMFVRHSTNSLIIADADGRTERTIWTLQKLPDSYFRGHSWSPDGQTIAAVISERKGASQSLNYYVAVKPINGGAERRVLAPSEQFIEDVQWLPDGRNLIMNARDEVSGGHQIYRLSYPDGAVRRITQDVNGYSHMSLTADGKQLLLVQANRRYNIFVGPLNDPQRARPISVGVGDYESVVWMPNGQLIYSRTASLTSDLWLTAPDGGQPRQLTTNAGSNAFATVPADGRYIVFNSSRTKKSQVWRMDPDGGNQIQLTTEGGANPVCSPDGKWIVYTNQQKNNGALWKMPLDGGPHTQLTDFPTSRASISPDGKFIAYRFIDAETKKLRVAIIPFEGGPPLKLFDSAAGDRYLCWASDSRAFLYIFGRAIKRQMLAGGLPQTLFELPVDSIFSFDLSLDGQQLAYISGQWISELVLLSETK